MFRLVHPQARQRAIEQVKTAPEGWIVTVKEPTRNLEQNAKLWALLGDVSAQVDWYGKKLSPEDWKHIFSSGLKRLTVVPAMDGQGFVALGLSTSRMSVREMSDLIELIQAFGSEKGVVWSEQEEMA